MRSCGGDGVGISQRAAGTSGLGLRALFYCVFEKTEGPTVLYSDPPDAAKEMFKECKLGRYLLPETFARGRVVSVTLDDNVILGAPVYIEDTQYDRNIFQFNICVVIGSHVDSAPHHELAQHLAANFRTLEVELKLLSDQEKVTCVQGLLKVIRAQLNASTECFVRVAYSYCIAFRVRRASLALVAEPGLAEVPVPLVNLDELVSASGDDPRSGKVERRSPGGLLEAPRVELDPTLLQILPFVNGVRTVQEVIAASKIDGGCVLLCLRHLLHFGFIAIIDAISLEKSYRITPLFHDAFEKTEVRAEVVRYVTAGRWEEPTRNRVQAVMSLYAKMDGWRTNLGGFQQEHAEALRQEDISLRHLITFGLLQGFLEPIEKFEKALSDNETRELQGLRAEIPALKQEFCEKGMTLAEANQRPEIQAKVLRMNQLKGKERQTAQLASPSISPTQPRPPSPQM